MSSWTNVTPNSASFTNVTKSSSAGLTNTPFSSRDGFMLLETGFHMLLEGLTDALLLEQQDGVAWTNIIKT